MAEHSSHASHAAGQSHAPAASANPHGQHHPYRRFAAMLAVSFVAMYFLMYAMVDRLDHVWRRQLGQIDRGKGAHAAAPRVSGTRRLSGSLLSVRLPSTSR